MPHTAIILTALLYATALAIQAPRRKQAHNRMRCAVIGDGTSVSMILEPTPFRPHRSTPLTQYRFEGFSREILSNCLTAGEPYIAYGMFHFWLDKTGLPQGFQMAISLLPSNA